MEIECSVCVEHLTSMLPVEECFLGHEHELVKHIYYYVHVFFQRMFLEEMFLEGCYLCLTFYPAA